MFCIDIPDSPSALLTAIGYANEPLSTNLDALHVTACLPCYADALQLQPWGEYHQNLHAYGNGGDEELASNRIDLQTYRSCCLMITLERICRDDVTTAAQVSSAELSTARTVKNLCGTPAMN